MHWIMAAGILTLVGTGFWIMLIVLDDSPQEAALTAIHISIGVTFLVLLAVRIALRMKHKPPPLPHGLSEFEHKASHIAHMALYVVPAIVMVAGYAKVNFSGDNVEWFGVSLPRLFPETGETLQQRTEDLHMIGAVIIVLVVVVHVAAVIKHRWFDGHDVLSRMTI